MSQVPSAKAQILAHSGEADVVLYGGTVYDGTGVAGIAADVALRGDTILAVGPGLRSRFSNAKAYDVSGCAVAPGFIDIHTHSDLTVLAVPSMSSSIHQGVTTELTGNCGMSVGLVEGNSEKFKLERTWLEREGVVCDWARFSGFLDRVSSNGVAINIASLAGHGTIRKAVMEFAERPPDARELAAMRRLVADAMEDGAFGLSTGLEYLPGGYADADEIAALAEIAQQAGGFYASHMRSEGDTLLECVDDTIAIGKRTGIAVQLSHHKAEGKANWNKTIASLARMDAARAGGYDVLTDQYPYTAFMTSLVVILLPEWARHGTPEEILARLTDPESRVRIEKEIADLHHDYDAIQIGIARVRSEIQGLTLAQLGKRDGVSPITAGIDLLIGESGWVGATHFALCEEDVERILRDPHTMIGSDGVATTPDAPERPHPRSYGTFPRVLSEYVRNRGVITLADAIYRMTGLPARRLNLTERGHITAGKKADITVFRADSVTDKATFDNPHQYPTGIEYVFVNGQLALAQGIQTDTRAGAVLRRP